MAKVSGTSECTRRVISGAILDFYYITGSMKVSGGILGTVQPECNIAFAQLCETKNLSKSGCGTHFNHNQSWDEDSQLKQVPRPLSTSQ